MIIKSFDLNKTDLTNIHLFLFYGKNEGLQNELIQKKFIENFNGQINKYEESEFITNNESILVDLKTKSLFENKKIIIISRTTDKILSFIKEISEIKMQDFIIILKSISLEKKSKLRSYFEKDRELITIPVYEDNYKDLLNIINEFISKNKINLSREGVNLLINRSSGDRQNLKTELDKILNYSYSNKKIDLLTLKKLTNLAENHSVSELADNFLSKNRANIFRILNENNYSDEDCLLILRTILHKSKRLLSILEKNSIIKNVDEVISTIKPPIFWKDKEIVKKQANTWKLEDLKVKLYQINDIESLVKSNSKNTLNMVSDFIVNY